MDPAADITIEGKTTTYKLDVKSTLYGMLVKQLMTYTMTQDKNDLPIAVPLVLLLPSGIKKKVAKTFMNKNAQIVFHINDSWTFIWESVGFLKSGWYFDGEKIKSYEDTI